MILSVFLHKKTDKIIFFALVNVEAKDNIKENKTGNLGIPG